MTWWWLSCFTHFRHVYQNIHVSTTWKWLLWCQRQPGRLLRKSTTFTTQCKKSLLTLFQCSYIMMRPSFQSDGPNEGLVIKSLVLLLYTCTKHEYADAKACFSPCLEGRKTWKSRTTACFGKRSAIVTLLITHIMCNKEANRCQKIGVALYLLIQISLSFIISAFINIEMARINTNLVIYMVSVRTTHPHTKKTDGLVRCHYFWLTLYKWQNIMILYINIFTYIKNF